MTDSHGPQFTHPALEPRPNLRCEWCGNYAPNHQILTHRCSVTGRYPRQERHEHLRALDALRDADWWPHGRCACGAALDERGMCTDGVSCTRDRWSDPR